MYSTPCLSKVGFLSSVKHKR